MYLIFYTYCYVYDHLQSHYLSITNKFYIKFKSVSESLKIKQKVRRMTIAMSCNTECLKHSRNLLTSVTNWWNGQQSIFMISCQLQVPDGMADSWYLWVHVSFNFLVFNVKRATEYQIDPTCAGLDYLHLSSGHTNRQITYNLSVWA